MILHLVLIRLKNVMGIPWRQEKLWVMQVVFRCTCDISKDTIYFYFERLVEQAFDLSMTKRSILSISARNYDSVGLFSRITI